MLQVQNISKKFKIYHSPADRFKEILTGRQFHRDFIALDDISFKVGPGEILGIIGENGAGKSTLLKILSGIVIPDKGTVNVEGKITGLLELGTGFNYEMTGFENIYMNGTLIGMSRDEINSKKEQIIDFSELGEFINEPLKTYSSGMVMRLAFSIAIHAEPACFLVDEALSVGDAYFQQKCIERIQSFRDGGGAIIFVSHDLNMITSLCNKVMLLEKGKIHGYGNPQPVIDHYISMVCKKAHQGEKEVIIRGDSFESSVYHPHTTTKEIQVISIKIFDRDGKVITHIYSGDEVIFTVSFRSLRLIEEPVFGILLRNRYGLSVFGTNTYLLNQKVQSIASGKLCHVSFRITVPLQPDDYLLTFAIDNKGLGINSFREYIIRMNNIATLKVLRKENTPIFEGITDLSPEISVSTDEEINS